MKFQNKVVWITGGGSGIGRALAVEFAHRGADVAVSGRRAGRLEETVERVVSIGRRGLGVPLDVTDEPAMAGVVQEIVGRFGRLDVAVASAGLGIAGDFEQLTDAEWQRQIAVNLFGAIRTARYALPYLRMTSGRLAFIGSVAGLVPLRGNSAYCASKFALRAVALSLSQELAGTGVSCTVVNPGFVASEINRVDNAGVFDSRREDLRPKSLIWSAERAARAIVRAIARRKREQIITVHGKIAGFLGMHFPAIVHVAATRSSAGKASQRLARNKRS